MTTVIRLADHVPSEALVCTALAAVQPACGDWQLACVPGDDEVGPSVHAEHRLGFEISFFWSRDGWFCINMDGDVIAGPRISLELLLQETVLPRRPVT